MEEHVEETIKSLNEIWLQRGLDVDFFRQQILPLMLKNKQGDDERFKKEGCDLLFSKVNNPFYILFLVQLLNPKLLILFTEDEEACGIVEAEQQRAAVRLIFKEVESPKIVVDYKTPLSEHAFLQYNLPISYAQLIEEAGRSLGWCSEPVEHQAAVTGYMATDIPQTFVTACVNVTDINFFEAKLIGALVGRIKPNIYVRLEINLISVISSVPGPLSDVEYGARHSDKKPMAFKRSLGKEYIHCYNLQGG